MSVINFYEQIPKKFLNQNKFNYISFPKIQIPLPMRGLFIGPSGSMKSNGVLNLIRTINGWDKIYLIAKQVDQPLYRYLKDIMGEHLVLSDNLMDLPTLENFNPDISSLIVFDDFTAEDKKSLDAISKFFVKGRHRGCSVIYISQSYFDTPKLIRKNSDYVFLLKLNTKRDMSMFLREYQVSDIDIDDLMKMYNEIKRKAKENFMLFDMITNNKNLKYRMNWDGIEIFEKNKP